MKVAFRVERREVLTDVGAPTAAAAAGAPPEAANTLDPYLVAHRLVPLTPRVRSLAKSIAGGSADPIEKARKFYEYLVTNGTYDKVAPGWGRGDSERFCDVKKGNSTDFHSLFLALARSEGIPARFRMGFSLRPEREGTVSGYHCWAEFFAPGRGWIPVDASEAAKSADASRRAFFFGNLDPDRFEVSTGRDLTFSPAQKDGPVNLLIAPYVEVDGKAFGKTTIKLEYKNAA